MRRHSVILISTVFCLFAFGLLLAQQTPEKLDGPQSTPATRGGLLAVVDDHGRRIDNASAAWGPIFSDNSLTRGAIDVYLVNFVKNVGNEPVESSLDVDVQAIIDVHDANIPSTAQSVP
jgi:hypothetical protein